MDLVCISLYARRHVAALRWREGLLCAVADVFDDLGECAEPLHENPVALGARGDVGLRGEERRVHAARCLYLKFKETLM